MKRNMPFYLVLVCVLSLCAATASFSQEIPKPGTTINKSNYKQYAHLFPAEILQGFETGWGGLLKPISIMVSATKSAPMPPKFVALSDKNKGKFGLDKDGLITGGWDYQGMPFPAVNRTDKDFTMKLMWNYGYKYHGDNSWQFNGGPTRRKGEVVTGVPAFGAEVKELRFVSRIFDDPKPFYKTPNKWQYADVYVFRAPGANGMLRLEITNLDPTALSETYMYVPTLRRTTRSDSSARSTPQPGSMEAADDFDGFNGKTYEFTYELMKEQKVLALATGTPLDKNLWVKAKEADTVYLPYDNWEVRDVYVIAVKPKNPRYPQGKKIIYMDKENYNIYYAVASDRAGKLWKTFICGYTPIKLGDGSAVYERVGMLSVDSQDDMASYSMTEKKFNGYKYKAEQFRESELIKMGK